MTDEVRDPLLAADMIGGEALDASTGKTHMAPDIDGVRRGRDEVLAVLAGEQPSDLLTCIAALRPGCQWHGRGGAARQRLRVVRFELGDPVAVSRVTFVRTAGAERAAMGREVTCALDQLVAAFEPDPRGLPYAHLTDAQYSVVRQIVACEGATDDALPDDYVQAIAEEFDALLGRLGTRIAKMVNVQGLTVVDYAQIAAACFADDFEHVLYACAPEVKPWPVT